MKITLAEAEFDNLATDSRSILDLPTGAKVMLQAFLDAGSLNF
jgi:hypothetical protein